jgi:hypothetical protein
MLPTRNSSFIRQDRIVRDATREFLCPEVSRSGLDRCLRRHGVGNLRDLLPKEAKAPRKAFKTYEPGFLHLDVKYLPQMADEKKRRYLFVAIDRATRWVYLEVKEDKTAKSASAFLKNLSWPARCASGSS